MTGNEPESTGQAPEERRSYRSEQDACAETINAISLDFGEFVLEQIEFFEQQLDEIRAVHEKDPHEAFARKDRLMRAMLQRIKNEIRKLQKKPLPFDPRGADNVSEIRTILAKFLILAMIIVEKLEEVQKLLPKEKKNLKPG
jgi:hypothetical protein